MEKGRRMQNIDSTIPSCASGLRLDNERSEEERSLEACALLQLPPEKFEKVWQSVWSVFFNYFDVPSLLHMTSINKKYRTHKKYIWKTLVNRECNKFNIYLNKTTLINQNPVDFQTVYLQLKKLRIPLNDSYLMIAAASKGYEAVVDLFVAHYPDYVNARCYNRSSPLSNAVNFGHTHIARTLLKVDATQLQETCWLYTLFWPIRHTGTLLMLAALSAQIEMMKTLIEFGANIEARDSNGRTVLILVCDRPVHIELKKKQMEVLKALLEFKPDLEAQDHDGKTALSYATAAENVEITGLLTEMISQRNGALQSSQRDGQQDGQHKRLREEEVEREEIQELRRQRT